MLKIRAAVNKNRMERGFADPESQSEIAGSAYSGTDSEAAASLLTQLSLDGPTLRKNRVFRGHDHESGSMAYKMLRTQVYQALRRNRWNRLGVTSANPAEGKTTTAINLAFSLAHSVYEKVILIDFDLRRPNVHNLLGMRPEIGLSDYYKNPEVTVKDVMYNSAEDLVVIIPGRQSLNNASELLVSRRTKALLAEVKSIFPSHLIIFDLPPVLVVDDVIAFSEKDACLVVVSEGRTKKEELENAVELLKTQTVLGYVLNMSETSAQAGYYKKYGTY